VLFNVVITKYGAEIFKIICLAYAIGEASSFGRGGTGADKVKKERARFEVKPVDDEFWEGQNDDVEGTLEDDEEKAEEEGDVFV
jgi:hypothetical protein